MTIALTAPQDPQGRRDPAGVAAVYATGYGRMVTALDTVGDKMHLSIMVI